MSALSPIVFDIAGLSEEIDLAATGIKEIMQNIRILLTTIEGELFLDRDFGISWRPIDMPIHKAAAEFTQDIITKIQLYEPRARVVGVDFTRSADSALAGGLVPVVRCELSPGALI